MNRPLISGLTLSSIALFSPICLGQMGPEIISRVSDSTAFVEVDIPDGKSFGSAFCADEPGLFVTNAHVVEQLRDGGRIKLALRTGEEDQRILAAKVYRSDPIVDLALLTTEVGERLVPLPLGRDAELFITMQAGVFGYPFGPDRVLRKGDLPTISVNLPRISSFIKEKGKVQLIQFDGQLNQGNSGGPVIGADGKVLGVATLTVVGGGLNFAIPASRLAQFLAAPGLEFRPTALTSENCSEPTDWTIRVLPSKPSARLPGGLSVSVKVTVDNKSSRTVMAKPDGDENFKVSIIPVPESLVTQAPEMEVEVVVELKHESKLLTTTQRRTRIARPVNLVITPRGRVLVVPNSNTDKGLLTVDGKLESDGIPRGAGRSIRPPEAAIGPVRLTLSPDPPSRMNSRAVEDLQYVGHRQDACTVDISPDGRKLLSGSEDGTVRLWDVESGKLEKVLTGHVGRVHQVVFSPDGKKALSGGADRVLRLWDLSTGQVIRTFRGHTDWVLAFAFTPDGKKVLSAGGARSIWNNGRDFAVRVWDADTAKLLATWPGHTGMVFALRVSPDGKLVLTAANDGTARLWELSSGKVVRQFPGQHAVGLDAVFTPDGKSIVVSGDGNVARIFDVADGREASVLRGHTSQIGSISISKDGSRLATGAWAERTIRVWSLPEGKELTQANPTSNPPYAVLTPDGRKLICSCSDGSIHRFPMPEPPPAVATNAGAARLSPLSVKVNGTITDVTVGGGGRYLILSLRNPRALAIFDVNLAKVVKMIPVAQNEILVAAGAKTMVVAFPGDRLMERWDLATLTQKGERISSPIKGIFKGMVMGNDSDGPLTVIWNADFGNGMPEQARISFLDPLSLKVLKVDASSSDGLRGNVNIFPSGGTLTFQGYFQRNTHARASSGGDLFAFWNTTVTPNGFETLAIGGGSLRARYRHESFAGLVPGPDGQTIYTGIGTRLDPDGSPVGQPGNQVGRIPRVAIPSMDPAYFLMVTGLSLNETPMNQPIRVSLHSSNDGDRLLTMGDLDEMESVAAPDNLNPDDFSVEKRFHHIPAADLLVTIPWSNDRVVLRRLEIEKTLGELSADYLLITSPPTLFAYSGKPFRHQIRASSSKGKLNYERSSGPDGLTVSPTGEISWPNPPRAGSNPAIAEIKVSNPAGVEQSYRARIRVK